MKIPELLSDYRIKLMSVICAIAAIILFLITTERNSALRELVLTRDLKRVNSIGRLVASEVGKYFRGESVEDIHSILSFIDKQTEINFILILENDGTVQYSNLKDLEGQPSPYEDSSEITREIGETYIRSFPIGYEEDPIGYVQLGYDMTPTKKTIHRSFQKALFSNFFLLVLIFFIGWYFSDRLMQPIKEVKKGAKSIARGNFSVRVPVRSKDILGQLAKSMNDMAGQLDELTKNMQKKIDETTSSLQKTNQKLQDQKKELKEKNEQLRELDKMKSDLISMVSHELKTPLTSMVGFGKTLLIRDLSEEKTRKYLKIIVSEGNRLAYLVDEFLDISRIESGEFSINPDTFDLQEFLEEIVEIQRSQSDIKIRLNINDKENIKVKWDMNAVKQIILNILDNARRYSPDEKSVDINTDISDNEVKIKIRDYGPGVPEKDIDKIFDKFYRAHDKINARNKGTGLGLSIAKNIIEIHKGTLKVRRPEGNGTEFIVKLPKKVENNE
ncbi:MAG: ATP-binding protein [Elusimicrobiota bacterium]